MFTILKLSTLEIIEKIIFYIQLILFRLNFHHSVSEAAKLRSMFLISNFRVPQFYQFQFRPGAFVIHPAGASDCLPVRPFRVETSREQKAEADARSSIVKATHQPLLCHDMHMLRGVVAQDLLVYIVVVNYAAMHLGDIKHFIYFILIAVYDSGHASGVLKKSVNCCDNFHLVFFNPVAYPRRDELEPELLEHVRLLVVVHGVDASGGEANDGPIALDIAAVVEEEAIGFVDDHQLVNVGFDEGIVLGVLIQLIPALDYNLYFPAH